MLSGGRKWCCDLRTSHPLDNPVPHRCDAGRFFVDRMASEQVGYNVVGDHDAGGGERQAGAVKP